MDAGGRPLIGLFERSNDCLMRRDTVSRRSNSFPGDRSPVTVNRVIFGATLLPKASRKNFRQGRIAIHGNAPRVYNSEGSRDGRDPRRQIVKGDVIVIRYEGRAAGRGCAKCFFRPRPPSWAKGLGKDVALITDGRFSGGSHASSSAHQPEAYARGPLAFVEDGDAITIDAENGN